MQPAAWGLGGVLSQLFGGLRRGVWVMLNGSGGGVCLVWGEYRTHMQGAIPGQNKFLLLQNYFHGFTLLSKLPKGLTSICE